MISPWASWAHRDTHCQLRSFFPPYLSSPPTLSPLPVLTFGPSRDRGATLSCLLPEVMHINQAHRCQITSNQEHTKAQQEVIIASVRAALPTHTSRSTPSPDSPDGLGFSSAHRSAHCRGVILSNAAENNQSRELCKGERGYRYRDVKACLSGFIIWKS